MYPPDAAVETTRYSGPTVAETSSCSDRVGREDASQIVRVFEIYTVKITKGIAD